MINMTTKAVGWADMPLFAGRTSGLPYQSHSPTSIAAAGRAAGGAATIRERIYEAIAGAPDGLTDLEIQELLGLDGSTQRPRRIELQGSEKLNLPVRIMAIGIRKTPSGRAAMV